jgi:hypothetical protein
MSEKRADNFYLGFFLEIYFKIWENEHELGGMLLSQVAFCCGMTR